MLLTQSLMVAVEKQNIKSQELKAVVEMDPFPCQFGPVCC